MGPQESSSVNNQRRRTNRTEPRFEAMRGTPGRRGAHGSRKNTTRGFTGRAACKGGRGWRLTARRIGRDAHPRIPSGVGRFSCIRPAHPHHVILPPRHSLRSALAALRAGLRRSGSRYRANTDVSLGESTCQSQESPATSNGDSRGACDQSKARTGVTGGVAALRRG